MFAVVWKYEGEETRVLIDIPEVFQENTSSEQAIKEGRLVMDGLQDKIMTPISVVQVNQVVSDGLDVMDDFEIPGVVTAEEPNPEWLTFKDITDTTFWSDQPWWPSK